MTLFKFSSLFPLSQFSLLSSLFHGSSSLLVIVDRCLFVTDLSSSSSISASSSPIFSSLSISVSSSSICHVIVDLCLFVVDLSPIRLHRKHRPLCLFVANLSLIHQSMIISLSHRSVSNSPIYDYLSLTPWVPIWAYFGGFVIWFWVVGL